MVHAAAVEWLWFGEKTSLSKRLTINWVSLNSQNKTKTRSYSDWTSDAQRFLLEINQRPLSTLFQKYTSVLLRIPDGSDSLTEPESKTVSLNRHFLFVFRTGLMRSATSSSWKTQTHSNHCGWSHRRQTGLRALDANWSLIVLIYHIFFTYLLLLFFLCVLYSDMHSSLMCCQLLHMRLTLT